MATIVERIVPNTCRKLHLPQITGFETRPGDLAIFTSGCGKTAETRPTGWYKSDVIGSALENRLETSIPGETLSANDGFSPLIHAPRAAILG